MATRRAPTKLPDAPRSARRTGRRPSVFRRPVWPGAFDGRARFAPAAPRGPPPRQCRGEGPFPSCDRSDCTFAAERSRFAPCVLIVMPIPPARKRRRSTRPSIRLPHIAPLTDTPRSAVGESTKGRVSNECQQPTLVSPTGSHRHVTRPRSLGGFRGSHRYPAETARGCTDVGYGRTSRQ